MKTVILIFAFLIPAFLYSFSQEKATLYSLKTYRTFIYTSDNLAEEIQRVNDNQDATRRFDADLLNASLNAAKGIGAGYVSSFIDLGVNTLTSLITRNSRLQKEWEETVTNENKWNTCITTVQEVKDFYKRPSRAGALDPMDMSFNGIGCLRMEGADTVFFVSCHIDRSKLYRIVNHSKFELVLDTLILSPTRSNLPNTQLPLEFSFNERGNFNMCMNIRLYSSWFTDAIELHNNTQLGEFNICVLVDSTQLDSRGFLRYIRHHDEPSEYEIVGESFIVPRSYMGFREKDGRYNNIWGTGQYRLDIQLTESCDITETYRKNWKNDRKRRNKMMPKNGIFTTVWQTVSSQHWDEISKQWVITTLSAPAGVISKELIEQMGLSVPATAQKQGASTPQQVSKK